MENEPVWMSHREDYAYRLLYRLQSTLMPREWVSKRFDEGMEEYDRQKALSESSNKKVLITKKDESDISEQGDSDIPG